MKSKHAIGFVALLLALCSGPVLVCADVAGSECVASLQYPWQESAGTTRSGPCPEWAFDAPWSLTPHALQNTPPATPPPANTAPAAPAASSPQPAVRFKVGIGITDDPGTTLFVFEGTRMLEQGVGAGGLLQFGVTDSRTIIAPTINLSKDFDLGKGNASLKGLGCYVNGGLGIAYLEKDNNPGDDSDAGLLLNIGGGLRFRFDQGIGIGAGLLFNFMPGEVLDERFFLSVDILSIVVEF